jgi:small subunit ribosomal protein S17
MEKDIMENKQEMNMDPVENTKNMPLDQDMSSEPAAKAAKAAGTPAKEAVETKKSSKRILQGRDVSNKSDKTIVVSITRQVAHPLYKKYFKRTKKFMAHDAQNDCNIGDTVKIRECRPMSARKRWELIEVVERAK